MEDFNEFGMYEDDAQAWEENEVAHDRELDMDEEFDGSCEDESEEDYEDEANRRERLAEDFDDYQYDNDIDFGIEG